VTARTIVYDVGGVGTLGPTGAGSPDPYRAKLIKLIPAEVVSGFVAVNGAIRQQVEAAEASLSKTRDALAKAEPAGEVADRLREALAVGMQELITAHWLALIALLVGAVLAPLYLKFLTREEEVHPSRLQYGLTVAAFVVWALATGEPLAALWDVPPLVVAVLLPLFVLAAPLLGAKKSEGPQA
jgi:hypothetical protein